MSYLPDRRTEGQPDPAEVISVTFGGHTFPAGRRTAAHLEFTFAAFAKAFPDLELTVPQGCYHKGYAPSAGTHDLDAVIDFYVLRNGSVLAATDKDYLEVQHFMRFKCGWGVWFRHTGSWAARHMWHLHSISIGCPGPVGIYVPAQVDDYFRGALGLKGQHDSGSDSAPRPDDINSVIFNYPAYLQEKDDIVTPEDRKSIVSDVLAGLPKPEPIDVDALAKAVTKVLLATDVGEGVSVRAALRKGADSKAIGQVNTAGHEKHAAKP